MSRFIPSQSGFETVAVTVAVLLVAIVGFAGYKVTHMRSSDAAPATVSSRATVPETIETKADLTRTGASLDQSSAEFDNTLDDSSLDADLNAML